MLCDLLLAKLVWMPSVFVILIELLFGRVLASFCETQLRLCVKKCQNKLFWKLEDLQGHLFFSSNFENCENIKVTKNVNGSIFKI